MAKSPDRPGAPRKPVRDPAKHSQKDPARPTRAKADRERVQPLAPALADLLNPAIGKGTAGVGAQTGLQPPADNSFDRRADFSKAHTARKSVKESSKGLGQARVDRPRRKKGLWRTNQRSRPMEKRVKCR